MSWPAGQFVRVGQAPEPDHGISLLTKFALCAPEWKGRSCGETAAPSFCLGKLPPSAVSERHALGQQVLNAVGSAKLH